MSRDVSRRALCASFKSDAWSRPQSPVSPPWEVLNWSVGSSCLGLSISDSKVFLYSCVFSCHSYASNIFSEYFISVLCLKMFQMFRLGLVTQSLLLSTLSFEGSGWSFPSLHGLHIHTAPRTFGSLRSQPGTSGTRTWEECHWHPVGEQEEIRNQSRLTSTSKRWILTRIQPMQTIPQRPQMAPWRRVKHFFHKPAQVKQWSTQKTKTFWNLHVKA